VARSTKRISASKGSVWCCIALAILVVGCGSSSKPAAPNIAGATQCGQGITSNNCDFAQAVYAAFESAWATQHSPPSSLTVRTNPVACSARAGDVWYCRSRIPAVALEFHQHEAPSAQQLAPPANQVQQAVVAILNTCIKHSFDNTVDLGPVSQATDKLIQFSHTYNLDAPLAPTDLKAHTLREALANARDTLRTCSPSDASHLDSVLGGS
jgi:hypothetical protein